jgi:hypothetical protein
MVWNVKEGRRDNALFLILLWGSRKIKILRIVSLGIQSRNLHYQEANNRSHGQKNP